jgi:hypothetical protein
MGPPAHHQNFRVQIAINAARYDLGEKFDIFTASANVFSIDGHSMFVFSHC